jgi:hypothetical protein
MSFSFLSKAECVAESSLPSVKELLLSAVGRWHEAGRHLNVFAESFFRVHPSQVSLKFLAMQYRVSRCKSSKSFSPLSRWVKL